MNPCLLNCQPHVDCKILAALNLKFPGARLRRLREHFLATATSSIAATLDDLSLLKPTR